MTSKEEAQRQSTLGCPHRSAHLLQAACLTAPLGAPCNYGSQTALGQAFLPNSVELPRASPMSSRFP